MKIQELTHFLENHFPLSSQADFDNCGLLIGDASAEITGVMTCLDVTEEVMDEAMDLHCNVIVAHHPLIFKGLKKITGKNYVERMVLKAIQNDIAIYAIHTNLDHSIRGVNARIAQKLQLESYRILAPTPSTLCKIQVFVPTDYLQTVENAMFAAGAGKLGNYDSCSFQQTGIGSFKPLVGANPFEGKIGFRSFNEEKKVEMLVSKHALSAVLRAMNHAHPYEEVAYDVFELHNTNSEEGSGMIGVLKNPMEVETFLMHLKHIFQCEVIRHTELLNKPIEKVAFCGGSGSFLIQEAIRQDADIYITGDLKYHEFFDAERKIILADIGHFESEQYTIELLEELISTQFSELLIHKTSIHTNPISYF